MIETVRGKLQKNCDFRRFPSWREQIASSENCTHQVFVFCIKQQPQIAQFSAKLQMSRAKFSPTKKVPRLLQKQYIGEEVKLKNNAQFV